MYRALHAWRPPHTVESNCSGVRLHYSSRNISGEEFYANAFERRERELLDKIITPGLTVLDVGANLGFFTCLFAHRVGPTGRVIAFEPSPDTFRLLNENVRTNGFKDLVDCRCCALSDTEGTARLHVFSQGYEGYNSLGASRFSDSCAAVAAIDVGTTTIDRCLEQAGADSCKGYFIKVDVEGFEQRVLAGGLDHLNRIENLSLMVELYEPSARQCGSSTLETLDLLESCGFHAYRIAEIGDLAPLDGKSRAELIEARLYPNVFFFKPASMPRWLAGREVRSPGVVLPC